MLIHYCPSLPTVEFEEVVDDCECCACCCCWIKYCMDANCVLYCLILDIKVAISNCVLFAASACCCAIFLSVFVYVSHVSWNYDTDMSYVHYSIVRGVEWCACLCVTLHKGWWAMPFAKYINIRIHTYTYTHTYTYIHTYIQTYIHTYIHTYILTNCVWQIGFGVYK